MPAVSDAVWSEQGTTPDAIEAALRELLAERHSEDGGFLPARVLNMVAFVESEWSGEIANRLRGVGRYHASRLVVLSYDPKRTRLDAHASVAAEGEAKPGDIVLLHETVIVELGDRHLDDLLTIADPLVVSDLPTLLWSPHGHPEAVEALLAMSGQFEQRRLARPAYQLAVLDAFAGDAIPVHLLTIEAFAVYLRELNPDGVIAIHVTNRYLDLQPVIREAAEHFGLTAARVHQAGNAMVKPSDWILLARNSAVLERIELTDQLTPLATSRDVRPWTDDYSNLFQILK